MFLFQKYFTLIYKQTFFELNLMLTNCFQDIMSTENSQHANNGSMIDA